jgi:Leucine-rich repeat (LRR) protein
LDLTKNSLSTLSGLSQLAPNLTKLVVDENPLGSGWWAGIENIEHLSACRCGLEVAPWLGAPAALLRCEARGNEVFLVGHADLWSPSLQYIDLRENYFPLEWRLDEEDEEEDDEDEEDDDDKGNNSNDSAVLYGLREFLVSCRHAPHLDSARLPFPWIFCSPRLAVLPALTSLTLEGQGITSIPGGHLIASAMPNLESLDLSRNHITSVVAVHWPKALSLLNLTRNRILVVDGGVFEGIRHVMLEGNPVQVEQEQQESSKQEPEPQPPKKPNQRQTEAIPPLPPLVVPKN